MHVSGFGASRCAKAVAVLVPMPHPGLKLSALRDWKCLTQPAQFYHWGNCMTANCEKTRCTRYRRSLRTRCKLMCMESTEALYLRECTSTIPEHAFADGKRMPTGGMRSHKANRKSTPNLSHFLLQMTPPSMWPLSLQKQSVACCTLSWLPRLQVFVGAYACCTASMRIGSHHQCAVSTK